MRIALVIAAAGCDGAPSSPMDVVDAPTPTDLTDPDDADNDGYPASIDCDDTDADVHPLALETCNGIDDDCAGGVDDDPVDGSPGFADADGDRFGDEASPVVSCVVPGWSPVAGDCDDADATRFPGATELCNGVDDDCDLVADDEVVERNGVLHATIAEAMVGAEDEDTIIVCGGVHAAGGLLVDRDLTFRSLSGDPTSTAIDGSSVDSSVFVVDGGNLTLEGLTIQGGSGLLSVLDVVEPVDLGGGRAGGGVNAVTGAGGDVTVRSCVFTDNEADGGGAIAARTLTITDSTFSGNQAISPGYSQGGALWIDAGSVATIERTVFDGNTGDQGGAVFSQGDTVLVDVEAFDNVAAYAGGFGYVTTPGSLDLVAGDVHDNVAQDDGGGALWMLDADGVADVATVFHDNVSNTADAGIYDGGGALYVFADSRPVTWQGGTFLANAVEGAGGGAMFLDVNSGDTIEVSSVVVLDNVATVSGGGIGAFAFPEVTAGRIVIQDSVVEGNVAQEGGGIAVEGIGPPWVGPTAILDAVDVIANSSIGGGGLALDEAWVQLTGVTVSDNTAGQGGGVWMDVDSLLDVINCDVAGNLPDDVWFDDSDQSAELPDVGATQTCDGADGTCL